LSASTTVVHAPCEATLDGRCKLEHDTSDLDDGVASPAADVDDDTVAASDMSYSSVSEPASDCALLRGGATYAFVAGAVGASLLCSKQHRGTPHVVPKRST
jgi:hypothetical protein